MSVVESRMRLYDRFQADSWPFTISFDMPNGRLVIPFDHCLSSVRLFAHQIASPMRIETLDPHVPFSSHPFVCGHIKSPERSAPPPFLRSLHSLFCIHRNELKRRTWDFPCTSPVLCPHSLNGRGQRPGRTLTNPFSIWPLALGRRVKWKWRGHVWKWHTWSGPGRRVRQFFPTTMWPMFDLWAFESFPSGVFAVSDSVVRQEI